MNDRDPHAQGDELGRRAAAALHDDVARRTDVDAALTRVLDATDGVRSLPLTTAAPTSPSSRPHRRTWLAAAAAVVLVTSGAVVYRVVQNDDRRVVPADTSAPPAVGPSHSTTAETIGGTDPSPSSTTPDQPASSAPRTSGAAVETTTIPRPPASDVDALAGFPAPPPAGAAFSFPALLPPSQLAEPSQVRLTEWLSLSLTVERHVQTWANEDGAVLEISTDVGASPGTTPSGSSVEVWPWDAAAMSDSMTSGFAVLDLRDPRGTVTLWAAGLSEQQLVLIAEGMTTDDNGWQLGAGAPVDLVELHAGWRTADFASRTTQWDTGAVRGEMTVTLGMPDSIRTPFFTDLPTTVTDVAGAPALVTELPSGAGVSWSPFPDVVVVLGLSGTTDEALALARSLVVVDIPTWEAAGVIDNASADGCNSFFFC